MNDVQQPSRRATAAVALQSLLWLWLICLSVLVFLGHRAMHDLADRERVDSGLQSLEAQVAGLTQTTQALKQQPAAATEATLQDARQALEARIAQVEQALAGRAAADELQALRTEIEQIKASQTAALAAASAQPSSSKSAPKPMPPPLPFRIVGAELRASQPSVSVVPANVDVTVRQVQVLLPGDAIGPWRLQAIEGSTAVFQAGEQIRRVAIP